jgi:nucleoid DNA-binding protein
MIYDLSNDHPDMVMLVNKVAANTEMSKKSAELAVNAAFDALSKAMAEGEKITVKVNLPSQERARL